MKKHFTLLTLAITMLLSAASLVASAQASTATPAPFTTPSATTPIPTLTSDAGKFICSGTDIQLKLNTPDAAATHYEWYKYNASGTAVLVSKSTTATYSETPTAPGYYKYKLVQLNSHDCSSPASDVYTIYVMPPLEPQLAATNGGVVCSNQTGSETVISASGYDLHYAYTYQWSKDGAPVGTVQNLAIGATIPDLHVAETTNGTFQYKLVMAYKLAPGCTGEKIQPVVSDKTPVKPSIDFGN